MDKRNPSKYCGTHAKVLKLTLTFRNKVWTFQITLKPRWEDNRFSTKEVERQFHLTMSFPTGKAPERKNYFKKTIDADEVRRRRSETTVQIRKTVKEDRLNQRRRMVRTTRTLHIAPNHVNRFPEKMQCKQATCLL